jgi:hypothetical protein
VSEGGLKEGIIDGETGILLPSNPSVDMIFETISSLSLEKCLKMRGACERQAARFSEIGFLNKMRNLISSI